jgi:hypothetical protein
MLPVRFTGEHVSASEVERVAVALRDVEDCAMSGVASKLGEQDHLARAGGRCAALQDQQPDYDNLR